MSTANMLVHFISAINIIILVQSTPMLNQPPIQAKAKTSFYVLALQWGISFCRDQSGVLCRQPVLQTFFLHFLAKYGLWPYDDQRDAILPPCTASMDLSRSDVHHILLIRGINENWPNLLARESNLKFWSRQWQKHGRCLGLTPTDYFEKAIELKQKIDVQIGGSLIQFFRNKELPPDEIKRYYPDEFLGEIKNKMGVITQMQCNINKEGVYQLYEIRFCFTDNWELRNCPSHHEKQKRAKQYKKKKGPNSQRKSPLPPPLPPPSFHIGMCYGIGPILFPALVPTSPPPPRHTPPPPPHPHKSPPLKRKQIPPPPPPMKAPLTPPPAPPPPCKLTQLKLKQRSPPLTPMKVPLPTYAQILLSGIRKMQTAPASSVKRGRAWRHFVELILSLHNFLIQMFGTMVAFFIFIMALRKLRGRGNSSPRKNIPWMNFIYFFHCFAHLKAKIATRRNSL